MSVFYPATVVELHVRLEEPGRSRVVETPPATNAAPLPPGGLRELLSTSATDPYSISVALVPRSVRWSVNSVRVADTAEASISWRDLPIEPRSVRSAVLLVYACALAPEDFAAGVEPGGDGAGRRRSYCPTTRENLRFAGHVDQVRRTSGEQGDLLSLTARDFTALLIDRPVPTAVLRRINFSAPLLSVVAEIVHSLPATATMPIVADPDLLAEGIGLVPLTASSLRHALDAEGKTKIPAAIEAAQTTYWDLITDLCVLSGVVPVVELDTLRLRKPRTVFSGTVRKAPLLVWGGNLSRFDLSRSFGRTKEEPVEVRCFDPATKTTNVARYPKDDARPKSTPSGEGSSTTYHVRVVYDVPGDRLEALAEAIYRELSVQATEVELETREVSSWEVDAREADLLRLVAGDPVNVYARATDGGALVPLFRQETISEFLESSPQEIAGELTRRGIRPSVAPALASALRQAEKLSVFRCQEANHDFGEDGYKVTIKATTFATVVLGGES